MKVKRKIILFVFLALFFILAFNINAEEKKYFVDYSFVYQPDLANLSKTNVFWTIKITHLFSDVYVKNFKVIFPEYFSIEEIKARNETEDLETTLNKKNEVYEITINLKNPNIGKDSINNIYLSFVQNNLFKKIGNITEAFIPTIGDSHLNSYQIIVKIPRDFSQKISLSKPKPEKIVIDESYQNIYWINPKVKTIYAVFGEEQYYQYRIDYQIKNPGLSPGYFSIALLPETSTQKIYLDRLFPAPNDVYLDNDGNLIAKYLLLPMTKKDIRLEGKLKVTTKNNQDYIEYARQKINKQKNYLLADSQYWKINSGIPTLAKNPKDIYQFVLNYLDYNYDGISQNVPRIGAEKILSGKKAGLCLDYTDLFVSLAREKGIYSRAVIGYGYSLESRLRPVSLQGDILHAWPEFYNIEKGFWQPIDPTWEDTSGIDYFESLDLNHIAFVIYGKNDDRPAPAGFYNEDKRQKIFIQPTNHEPKEIIKIKLNDFNLPEKIFGNQWIKGKGIIVNQGNRYLYNLPISINSDLLEFKINPKKIEILPPLGKSDFEYQIRVKNHGQKLLTPKKATIQLKIANYLSEQREIEIFPIPYFVSLLMLIASLSITFFFFILKYIVFKK